MKIFFNGWFGGFFDKTNPGLNTDYYLNLFEKVYNEKCYIGSIEESEILCEFCMLISTTSKINSKKWKHTFMMSSENDCRSCENQKDKYDCVLWMDRNNKNIINMPLHIPYIYTNNLLSSLENQKMRTDTPEKEVLVVISNPNGTVRNKFLSMLEKKMNVTYAGRYKNNTGKLLPYHYNDEKFKNYVSQFKFVISMENTRYGTGITEKITHGMLAQTIPVYWGSERVNDYFNKDRFLNLKNAEDETIDEIITKILEINNDKTKWLNIVNKNVFPGDGKMWRTIDDIAKDIRCLLGNEGLNHIDKIYVISNKEGEPERYETMTKLFKELKIDDDYIKFLAPTYKHTITNEQYDYHAKKQWVLRMRGANGMKLRKGMLSLMLNYRETLRNIEKNYKDGKFFIFESDIIISKDIDKLNDFLDEIKDKDWDSIHIGMFQDNIFESPVTQWITGYRTWNEPLSAEIMEHITEHCGKKMAYRTACLAGCNGQQNFHMEKNSKFEGKQYIEYPNDDKFRIIRKFHTRCCDSIVWKYKGIVKYLKYMDEMEQNYSCPNDYLMTDFIEKNINFKHFHSVNEFFVQGSNLGLVKSAY